MIRNVPRMQNWPDKFERYWFLDSCKIRIHGNNTFCRGLVPIIQREISQIKNLIPSNKEIHFEELALTMVSDSHRRLQNQEAHEVSKRHIFGHYWDLKHKNQANKSSIFQSCSWYFLA